MLLSLLVVFPLGSMAACGGPQAAEEADSSKKKKKKKKHRDHPPDEDAVSEKGKSWGGWRWKGKRDDCFFVVANKCFETKKAACTAANCDKKACKVKEGAPSKVSCTK